MLFELMCRTANIDQGHYKYAKQVLFDEEYSNHGKLRWKSTINSPEILINILQPSNDKTNDFVYMYLDSFNEKQKFLSYLEYSFEKLTPILFQMPEKINSPVQFQYTICRITLG
jgi:hypothetical protein